MRRFEESTRQPASGTLEPDTRKETASERDARTRQDDETASERGARKRKKKGSKPGKSMEMPIELGTCTDRPFIGPPGASAVLSFNSSHGKGGLEFLQLISPAKSKKQDLIQTLLIYLHPTNRVEDSINDANNNFSEHLKQQKHQYLRWKNFRSLQDIEDLKQQQHESRMLL